MSKLIKMLIGFGAVIFILLWMMIPYLIEKPVVTTDYFTQYNDLTRPEGYNETDNAATLLSKLPQPELTEEQKESGDFSGMPDFMWSYEPGNYPDKFKPEDRIKFKNWINHYEITLQAIVKASRKPYYYKPVDPSQYRTEFLQDQAWDYYSTSYAMYDLSRMLSWAVVYHLEAGEAGKAAEYIESSLNLYKLLGKSAGVYQQYEIDQLIDSLDYIMAYLNKDNLSPDELVRLQQLFSQASDFPGFDGTCQRLIFLDFVQKAFTKGDRGHLVPSVMLREEMVSMDFDEAGSFVATLYKCIKCEHRKNTVDRMEAILTKLDQWKDQSLFQLHDQGIDYENELKSLTDKNFLIEEQTELLLHLFQAPQQTACKMQAFTAIAALHRYRLETGHYPDSLDALLQAGYIDRLPQDCYSNGPLVYRTQGDDFILYSLGVDFEDDGGQQSLCPYCGDHFVDWGDGPVKKPDDMAKEQDKTDTGKDAKGDHVFWPIQKESEDTETLPLIL